MILWQIVSWTVTGLLVGAVARLLLPGRDRMSLLMTGLLGIAGSFLGGWLASLFLNGGPTVQPAGLVGSVIGALLLLLVRRLFVSGQRA